MRRLLALATVLFLIVGGGSSQAVTTQPLSYSTTIAVKATGGPPANLTPGFIARSIFIDNPTGQWLKLTATRDLIPPATIGWRSLLAGVQQTTIEFVDAPIGGAASSAVGGPILVTMSQDETDDFPGEIYNLIPTIVNLQGSIASLQSSIDALKAGYGTGVTLLSHASILSANSTNGTVVAAPGVGNQIVVVAATVAAYNTHITDTGNLDVWLGSQGFSAPGPANVLGYAQLSRQSPTVSLQIPPGGATVGPLGNLRLEGIVEPVAGEPVGDQVLFMVYYYVIP